MRVLEWSRRKHAAIETSRHHFTPLLEFVIGTRKKLRPLLSETYGVRLKGNSTARASPVNNYYCCCAQLTHHSSVAFFLLVHYSTS